MGGWMCPGPGEGIERPDDCTGRVRSEEVNADGRCVPCAVAAGVDIDGEQLAFEFDEEPS